MITTTSLPATVDELDSSPLSSLITIPSEVRHRIFTNLARSHQSGTLASLLRTSNTIYGETLPFIYKNLHICSQKAYEDLIHALKTGARGDIGILIGMTESETGSAVEFNKGHVKDNFVATTLVTLWEATRGETRISELRL